MVKSIWGKAKENRALQILKNSVCLKKKNINE